MELQITTNLLVINLVIFMTIHVCSSSLIPNEALPTKSGYLKVNSTTNSSIFYTYYEAKQPIYPLHETPILIWLQGGPGCSSMVGNFYELGPWRVNRSLELEPNQGSWNRVFGLLFLDNPIGTGFSIAASIEEIPRNQYEVAKHLYIAIKSFIKLDKKLFGSRTIYITGESYAGKYGPSIGYYIVKKNYQVSKGKRINLGGIAIGNGLTDPELQVKTHAVNGYYSGLINEHQKSQLEDEQRKVVELVSDMKWSNATNARTRVLNMLQNMTGVATLYDMRRKTPYESDLVVKFLRIEEVRNALGVSEKSKIYEECSQEVAKALHEDVMKSVRYMVEYLLKESKVLLYQGQCDLRDGVVSVEAYMKELKWDNIDQFRAEERKVWKIEGKVAGYVQKWGSLSHVVILDAGHFVPTDQPVHSQVMIEDWVLGRGFFADQQIESSFEKL